MRKRKKKTKKPAASQSASEAIDISKISDVQIGVAHPSEERFLRGDKIELAVDIAIDCLLAQIKEMSPDQPLEGEPFAPLVRAFQDCVKTQPLNESHKKFREIFQVIESLVFPSAAIPLPVSPLSATQTFFQYKLLVAGAVMAMSFFEKIASLTKKDDMYLEMRQNVVRRMEWAIHHITLNTISKAYGTVLPTSSIGNLKYLQQYYQSLRGISDQVGGVHVPSPICGSLAMQFSVLAMLFDCHCALYSSHALLILENMKSKFLADDVPGDLTEEMTWWSNNWSFYEERIRVRLNDFRPEVCDLKSIYPEDFARNLQATSCSFKDILTKPVGGDLKSLLKNTIGSTLINRFDRERFLEGLPERSSAIMSVYDEVIKTDAYKALYEEHLGLPGLRFINLLAALASTFPKFNEMMKVKPTDYVELSSNYFLLGALFQESVAAVEYYSRLQAEERKTWKQNIAQLIKFSNDVIGAHNQVADVSDVSQEGSAVLASFNCDVFDAIESRLSLFRQLCQKIQKEQYSNRAPTVLGKTFIPRVHVTVVLEQESKKAGAAQLLVNEIFGELFPSMAFLLDSHIDAFSTFKRRILKLCKQDDEDFGWPLSVLMGVSELAHRQMSFYTQVMLPQATFIQNRQRLEINLLQTSIEIFAEYLPTLFQHQEASFEDQVPLITHLQEFFRILFSHYIGQLTALLHDMPHNQEQFFDLTKQYRADLDKMKHYVSSQLAPFFGARQDFLLHFSALEEVFHKEIRAQGKSLVLRRPTDTAYKLAIEYQRHLKFMNQQRETSILLRAAKAVDEENNDEAFALYSKLLDDYKKLIRYYKKKPAECFSGRHFIFFGALLKSAGQFLIMLFANFENASETEYLYQQWLKLHEQLMGRFVNRNDLILLDGNDLCGLKTTLDYYHSAFLERVGNPTKVKISIKELENPPLILAIEKATVSFDIEPEKFLFPIIAHGKSREPLLKALTAILSSPGSIAERYVLLNDLTSHLMTYMLNSENMFLPQPTYCIRFLYCQKEAAEIFIDDILRLLGNMEINKHDLPPLAEKQIMSLVRLIENWIQYYYDAVVSLISSTSEKESAALFGAAIKQLSDWYSTAKDHFNAFGRREIASDLLLQELFLSVRLNLYDDAITLSELKKRKIDLDLIAERPMIYDLLHQIKAKEHTLKLDVSLLSPVSNNSPELLSSLRYNAQGVRIHQENILNSRLYMCTQSWDKFFLEGRYSDLLDKMKNLLTGPTLKKELMRAPTQSACISFMALLKKAFLLVNILFLMGVKECREECFDVVVKSGFSMAEALRMPISKVCSSGLQEELEKLLKQVKVLNERHSQSCDAQSSSEAVSEEVAKELIAEEEAKGKQAKKREKRKKRKQKKAEQKRAEEKYAAQQKVAEEKKAESDDVVEEKQPIDKALLADVEAELKKEGANLNDVLDLFFSSEPGISGEDLDDTECRLRVIEASLLSLRECVEQELSNNEDLIERIKHALDAVNRCDEYIAKERREERRKKEGWLGDEEIVPLQFMGLNFVPANPHSDVSSQSSVTAVSDNEQKVINAVSAFLNVFPKIKEFLSSYPLCLAGGAVKAILHVFETFPERIWAEQWRRVIKDLDMSFRAEASSLEDLVKSEFFDGAPELITPSNIKYCRLVGHVDGFEIDVHVCPHKTFRQELRGKDILMTMVGIVCDDEGEVEIINPAFCEGKLECVDSLVDGIIELPQDVDPEIFYRDDPFRLFRLLKVSLTLFSYYGAWNAHCFSERIVEVLEKFSQGKLTGQSRTYCLALTLYRVIFDLVMRFDSQFLCRHVRTGKIFKSFFNIAAVTYPDMKGDYKVVADLFQRFLLNEDDRFGLCLDEISRLQLFNELDKIKYFLCSFLRFVVASQQTPGDYNPEECRTLASHYVKLIVSPLEFADQFKAQARGYDINEKLTELRASVSRNVLCSYGSEYYTPPLDQEMIASLMWEPQPQPPVYPSRAALFPGMIPSDPLMGQQYTGEKSQVDGSVRYMR